jgi:hypothetical protein
MHATEHQPFYSTRNEMNAHDYWCVITTSTGEPEVRVQRMVRTRGLKEIVYRTELWTVDEFLVKPEFAGTLVQGKLVRERQRLIDAGAWPHGVRHPTTAPGSRA